MTRVSVVDTLYVLYMGYQKRFVRYIERVLSTNLTFLPFNFLRFTRPNHIIVVASRRVPPWLNITRCMWHVIQTFDS